MYTDLNVYWPSNPVEIQAKKVRALKAATELVKLGFTVLAFNQTIHLPYPSKLDSSFQELQAWQLQNPNVKCLQRITVFVNDVTQYHKWVQTHPLHAYDLVALCPVSEKAWTQGCTELPCDLITFDITQNLPFHFRTTMVHEAQRRGIHFEISYVPAFKDDSSKRNLIANARNLIRVTQGKHTVVSSGCTQWIETRGVLDIINLGCLFGMNMDVAKHAITSHPRAAILHASTRMKTYRAAASVIPISELDPSEKWKAGEVLVEPEDNFIGFEEKE